MTHTEFEQRLIALGLPAEVAPGFAPDGAFRAFFDAPDAARIERYFADAPGIEPPPGPYFDPEYYRAENPDWREGGSALGHFLLSLLRGQTRPAHPLFDAAFYASRYADLRETGNATLLHFARYGDAELRQPSPGFDPGFYAARYTSLSQTRPFRHYATTGRARDHRPCPPDIAPGETRMRLLEQFAQATRPILLLGNDARGTGAPMLLLALGRALRARGWSPVFALQNGGPLVEAFEAIGPVTVLCEGWQLGELAGGALQVPLLALTVETAPLVAQIGAGRRACLMVLEMPAYWRMRALTGALEACARVGTQMLFGFPILAEGFAEDMPDAFKTRHSHVIRPSLLPPPESCADFLHHARKRRERGGPVIIGAGYADHRKGFDWFIATALETAKRLPGARFIWLGEISAWAEPFVEEARAQGLDLELPGFVEDANARYAAADLFLLSTRQDPGPTVLLDALRMGLSYIGFATDIGIGPLMSQYPQFGALVAPGDIEAAADAIEAQLAADSPAKRRLKRKIVAGELDFEGYVDDIEALIASNSA